MEIHTNKKLIALVVVQVVLFVVLGYLALFYDTKTMAEESMTARIANLEQTMQRKMHPVINIRRATVYTSKGEIVIEDISTR